MSRKNHPLNSSYVFNSSLFLGVFFEILAQIKSKLLPIAQIYMAFVD
tara:strand:- start:67 stop:207 length:141 start_codon:yes stop_codon:yes gene_type:complete